VVATVAVADVVAVVVVVVVAVAEVIVRTVLQMTNLHRTMTIHRMTRIPIHKHLHLGWSLFT
jgi:hypothetical protein